jgi:hypothetical protein
LEPDLNLVEQPYLGFDMGEVILTKHEKLLSYLGVLE